MRNPTTDEGANAPVPSLTRLAEEGINFLNGYAMPACSITRGARSYGLYPTTSGVGAVVGRNTPRTGVAGPFEGVLFPPTLVNPTDPNLLQKILSTAGYETLKLGKWHETIASRGATNLPEIAEDVWDSGFDHFVFEPTNRHLREELCA